MLELGIRKVLENFTLAIDLSLPAGSTLALFGPSGCGKSMTLRTIAGLERADSGYIRVEGVVFFDAAQGVFLPARKRRVGLLFQDYALFQHLRVKDNIAFGLRHVPKAERLRRVADIMERMRLAGLENRYPSQLSGGQQQRVALARTLVADPALLLLDEPFSALDSQVRKKLQRELVDLRSAYSGTTILVTHSLEEAFRLCSHIAVMDNGRIVQVAAREEILHNPATRTVARLTGMENIYDGVVIARDGKRARLWVEELGTCLTIPDRSAAELLSIGIRPSQVKVQLPGCTLAEQQANVFWGQVVQAFRTPDGQTLFVRLTRLVDSDMPINSGRDYDVKVFRSLDFSAGDLVALQAGDACQVSLPLAALALWPQQCR